MKRVTHHNSGFSLLELLLTLGILSIIVTAILGGLHLGRRAWEIGHLEDEKGDGEAALRAVSGLLAKAVPAIAIDGQKIARLVFVGRPNAVLLVTLSEGKIYNGGLILTEIGLEESETKLLGLWTAVFRASLAWSTQRESMRATVVLSNIVGFELLYYGSRDATSPPEWRSEWVNSKRLPILISLRLSFIRNSFVEGR